MMTETERARWLQGRYDWRDGSWQDHCGDASCEHCTGYIETNPAVAARRVAFEQSILGAEVENA